MELYLITEPQGSVAPRLTHRIRSLKANLGGIAAIPCLAQGFPGIVPENWSALPRSRGSLFFFRQLKSTIFLSIFFPWFTQTVPNVKWYKQVSGSIVAVEFMGHRLQQNPDGTLVVMDVVMDDEGSYVCIVSILNYISLLCWVICMMLTEELL